MEFCPAGLSSLQSFTTPAMPMASNQSDGRKILDSDCGEFHRDCRADLLWIQPLCRVSCHRSLGKKRNRLAGGSGHAGACGIHAVDAAQCAGDLAGGTDGRRTRLSDYQQCPVDGGHRGLWHHQLFPSPSALASPPYWPGLAARTPPHSLVAQSPLVISISIDDWHSCRSSLEWLSDAKFFDRDSVRHPCLDRLDAAGPSARGNHF